MTAPARPGRPAGWLGYINPSFALVHQRNASLAPRLSISGHVIDEDTGPTLLRGRTRMPGVKFASNLPSAADLEKLKHFPALTGTVSIVANKHK
jgi:hypothetical protein